MVPVPTYTHPIRAALAAIARIATTMVLCACANAAQPNPTTTPPPATAPLAQRILAAPPSERQQLLAEAISARARDDAALFEALTAALDTTLPRGARRELVTAISQHPLQALPADTFNLVSKALTSSDTTDNTVAGQIVRATWPACRDQLLELIRTHADWPRFAVLYADIEPANQDSDRRLVTAVRTRAATPVDPSIHWAVGDAIAPADERSKRLCELFKSKATLSNSPRPWHTSRGLSFMLDVAKDEFRLTFHLHVVNIGDKPVDLPRSLFGNLRSGVSRWAFHDKSGASLPLQCNYSSRVDPAPGQQTLKPGELLSIELPVEFASKPDASITLGNLRYDWFDAPGWPLVASWRYDGQPGNGTDWPGAVILDVTIP